MIDFIHTMKLCLIGVILFFSSGLNAQTTFTVTNTSDSGSGSLRQAIIDANENGDDEDIINFSSSISGTIFLNSQLPIVTSALTINGSGEEVLAISGRDAYRILFINSMGAVEINEITLTEGRASGGNGGGTSGGGGGGAGMGGAIFLEAGDLTLSFVTLSDNQARGGTGGFTNSFELQTASGGAGPFGGTPSRTTSDRNGENGVFGAGGSSGQLNTGSSSNISASGGNGGYGAGGGSGGALGGGAPGGPGGSGGTFGGNGDDSFTGGTYRGGSGAGLGAALFIYNGSATLDNVIIVDNITAAGTLRSRVASTGTGAERGMAKAAGIFHFEGNLVHDGIFFQGNTASDALTTSTDNADFFSEQSNTLFESNPPQIVRTMPTDGFELYLDEDPIAITLNENFFNTDGSSIEEADLQNIVSFKVGNMVGVDVPFTAYLDLNKIIVTPASRLVNGTTYYLEIDNIEDRNGNETTSPQSFTFTMDGTPPLFTSNPASGSVLLGNSFTLTSNEPIYTTSGAEIEPADFRDIIVARLNDENGEIVSTSVFVDGNDLKVTFDEALPNQTYHVEVKNIADFNGNVTAPQTFTYSRPSFAQANMRINAQEGSLFNSRLLTVQFEEEYYVENVTGQFAAFTSTSSVGAQLVVTLKEDDANGAEVDFQMGFKEVEGNPWTFDYSTLEILPSLKQNQQYYLSISNLYNEDDVPVEEVEVTFTTPDRFNPVVGSGYGRSLQYVYPSDMQPLGDFFTLEFFVKHESIASPTEAIANLWSNENSKGYQLWLNNGVLTFSELISNVRQTTGQIESSVTITSLNTEFHHFALTYSNGTATLQHNGLAVGSGSIDLQGSQLSTIGYYGSSSSGNLIFDEVRVWSAVPDQTVLTEWVNKSIDESHIHFSNLVNLWHFDEGSGDYGIDGVTKEANLCFSCTGQKPVYGLTNRFDQPEIQIWENGTMLDSDSEIVFIAGDGGQLVKEFTIKNVGTADLELTDVPFVSAFPSRFALDFPSDDFTLSTDEEVTFTITFQSSDVTSYDSYLTIPSNALNSNQEIKLTGRGISISNGIWQEVTGLPRIKQLFVQDDELRLIYRDEELAADQIAKLDTVNGVVKLTNIQPITGYGSPSFIERIVDSNGHLIEASISDFGSHERLYLNNRSTSISYEITTEAESDANNPEYTGAQMKLDNNGLLHTMYFFSDGNTSTDTGRGLKIRKGLWGTGGSGEEITISMQDIEDARNSGFIATYIYSYDLAFNSQNELYLAINTTSDEFFIMKYNETTGLDLLGYDYRNDDVISPSDGSQYLGLEIDGADNLHVGAIGRNQFMRYHKFSKTGEILESAWSRYDINPQYDNSSLTGDLMSFSLGAGNEPMFIYVYQNSKAIGTVVYEDGNFRDFNDTYVNGTDPHSTTISQFRTVTNHATGRPWVYYQEGIINRLYTTQTLAPELSVYADGQQLSNGQHITLGQGVGTEASIVLGINNSGLTDLKLNPNTAISFTGDQVEALNFDVTDLPARMTVEGIYEFEVTFAPEEVFSASEVLINITTDAGSFELTLVLESLDDTNSGEWEVYATLDKPIYSDADMAMGNLGLPIYIYNTYETLAGTGANAGVTIPYAKLHVVDPIAGTYERSPDDLSSDMSLPATNSLTQNYRKLQQLANPNDNASFFTMVTSDLQSIAYPWLYSASNASGLSRLDFLFNGGVSDLEYDEEGNLYKFYHDSQTGNIELRPGNPSEANISFSRSYTEADLDFEFGDTQNFILNQEGTSMIVRRIVPSVGLDAQFLSTTIDAHPGNASHVKDIETVGNTVYLAYINTSDRITVSKYDGSGWTDMANIATDKVLDLQLQIHPNGTPYVSFIEYSDLTKEYNVSVLNYNTPGAARTVGDRRIAIGTFQSGVAGLEDAPTTPALRAPFVIDENGKLFVMFADKIYSLNETPEDFNRFPAFTSEPVIEANEGEAYSYDIMVTDEDSADELSITVEDLPAWLTLTDNGDGTASLSGTPQDADALNVELTIMATDGRAIIEQSFELMVEDINTIPFFEEPQTMVSIDEGAEFFDVDLGLITDGDIHLEQQLFFSVVSDNEALINFASGLVNEGHGTLNFQVNTGETGVANLTVTLEDDGDPTLSVSHVIQVTVNALLPSFVSTPVISVNDNETYKYPIDVFDPNGDVVTVTGTGLPDFLSFEQKRSLTTLASGSSVGAPYGIALDSDGNILYTTATQVLRLDLATNNVAVVAGSGTLGGLDHDNPLQAQFNYSWGLVVDTEGNIFVVDRVGHKIRRIDALTGSVSTIAGSGIEGFMDSSDPLLAQFNKPTGIAIDALGNLYIADEYNFKVRKIDGLTGEVTTFAGSTNGDLDSTDPLTAQIWPTDIVIDAAGNFYLAEQNNQKIRKIDASTREVSTLTNASVPQGLVVDADNIYFTEAARNRIRKYDLLSGLTTTIAGITTAGNVDNEDALLGQFSQPTQLVINGQGELFVADRLNRSIKRVSKLNSVLTGDATGQAGSYDITLTADDGNGGIANQPFTLTVNDITPPALNSLATVSISENSEGTIPTPYTIEAEDSNTNNSGFTYALVSGANDNGLFTLTDNEIAFKSSTTLDYEIPLDSDENNDYLLQFTITDGVGNSSEVFDVTVSVTNIDEVPVLLSDASAMIAENTLEAIDVDGADEVNGVADVGITYAIVEDPTNPGNDLDGSLFQINSTTGMVSFIEAPDFENPSGSGSSSNQYLLFVSISDTQFTITESLTVNVTDVDENVAPEILDETISISERTAVGSLIDQFPQEDANGDAVTYAINTGNEAGDFTLSEEGQLTLVNPLDFETTPEYQFVISATDGELSDQATITIVISDVNEAPQIADQTISISEESGPLFTLGSISGFDPESDAITYTILSGNEDDVFTLTETGQLNLAGDLDFETTPTYELLVNGSDGELSDNAIITINVTDENEGPTGILLSSTEVVENMPAGTIVGTFTATDQDAGDSHSYEIVSSTIFFINDEEVIPLAISGENLVTAVELDYESLREIIIQIIAEDLAGGQVSDGFTISVTDVNEAPVILDQIFEVDEDFGVGRIVGQLLEVDDEGQTITYTINSGNEAGDFVIETNGNVLVANNLDFETASSYELLISGTDGEFSVDATITININDVNEAPIGITLSANTISENLAVGTSIGLLEAIDVDANATHTFSLIEDGGGANDNAAFGISDNTLVSAEVFDFEARSSYLIVVRADDGAGGVVDESLTITITDEQEGEAQTITFDELPAVTFGDDPFELTATASSNLPVSFISSDESILSISGTTAAILAAGEVTVTAAQAGNDDFNEASTSQTITIAKAAQTITFATLEDKVFDADPFVLGATASSSLAVSFEVAGPATLDGNELTMTGIGLVTVTASQIGNSNYLAATSVSQAFNVTDPDKTNQTITFDPIDDKVFGDNDFELVAVASSNLVVSFTSSDENVLSISGTTATILVAGEATITATQAGNDDFNGATTTQTITIAKAEQTITFDEIDDQVTGADPITLDATTNSALAIDYSVTGPASLEANVLTITGTGEVQVTASQAGNENYLAASVTRAFVVTDPAKTDQTITFNAPNFVYINETPIVLEASSDSGLDIEFEVISGGDLANLSGDNLNLTGVGTIEVAARQVGNDSFNPVVEVRTITIKPVFTIIGSVIDETGAIFTLGTAALILSGATQGPEVILEADGSYTFTNVKDGVYYLGIVPNNEEMYYSTAYGDAIIYQNATPVVVTTADVSGLDIQMVVRPNTANELNGEGVVTGRVVEDDDGSGNRIELGVLAEGDPIEGASIFLERKSDGKILTEVFSDSNGDFEISGIPEGTFNILINIPGVEGTISQEIAVSEDEELLMTAIVGEEGIVFDTEIKEVLAISPTIVLEVYPNPVTDFVTIEIGKEKNLALFEWKLIDLSGQIILEGKFINESNKKIDLRAISHGVYFLSILDESGQVSHVKISK